MEYNTVYFYYRKWKEQIHEFLRSVVRKEAGRNESPSLGIIDSRSLKTSRQNAQERGYDGGKKIKGRKQHIIVDTLGLLMAGIGANLPKKSKNRLAGYCKLFCAQIQLKTLRSCQKDGLWRELFLGSKVSGGYPKIMKCLPKLPNI